MVEFAIALEVQVSLHAADGENISNLWTDTDDAGFEGTQYWGAAVVASELLVEVVPTRPQLVICLVKNCEAPQSRWKSMPLV